MDIQEPPKFYVSSSILLRGTNLAHPVDSGRRPSKPVAEGSTPSWAAKYYGKR